MHGWPKTIGRQVFYINLVYMLFENSSFPQTPSLDPFDQAHKPQGVDSYSSLSMSNYQSEIITL